MVVLEGLDEVCEVGGEVWVGGEAALGGVEEGKSVDDEDGGEVDAGSFRGKVI